MKELKVDLGKRSYPVFIGSGLLAETGGGLRALGVDNSNILEETEKIEHTISKETLGCISVFLDFIEVNGSFCAEYDLFRKTFPPID